MRAATVARSDYIYAVMLAGQIPPLATFTVKHEMKTMLAGIEREQPSVLAQLRVYRMDDGHRGMIAEMDIHADIIDSTR